MKSISIIIAALNEERVISKVLLEIYSVVKFRFNLCEFIIINDGSADETGRMIDKFCTNNAGCFPIHNQTNIGLGACFKLGVQRAQYEYVMLLCGDGGLPALSLPAIFDKVGSADLVIPYMENLRRIKTPARYLLSRTYSNLLNLLFGFRLKYYNGLPVYRRSLLQAISINSEGFGFQGEILVKLLKSGCTYVQVGVDGAEETGKSSALRLKNVVSVGGTLVRLIVEILRFKPIPRDLIINDQGTNCSGQNDAIKKL